MFDPSRNPEPLGSASVPRSWLFQAAATSRPRAGLSRDLWRWLASRNERRAYLHAHDPSLRAQTRRPGLKAIFLAGHPRGLFEWFSLRALKPPVRIQASVAPQITSLAGARRT